MKTLSRNALTAWAQLQEILAKRNPDRPNPNDDFKKLTKEERNARLEVKINNLIQDIRAEKIGKFK